MKKITHLLLALLCVTQLFGKVVPLETARLTAYNFLMPKVGHQNLPAKESLTLEYTSVGASGANCFYIFNASTGFIIISADDAVNPVLAFSKEGSFNGSNIPANVLYLISNYNSQINNVISISLTAAPDVADKWNTLLGNTHVKSAAKTTSVVVSPLLGTIMWDQAPNYNDSCPNDATGGGLSVTGCVATATAQVMKYWHWPAQGVGSHSYTTTTRSFNLTAGFNHPYNWSAMPNSISAHNADIAQLMYDVGVAVDMDYTQALSGAYVISAATGTPPNCAQYALTQYFKYDPAAIQGLARSSYTDAAWLSMMKTDLIAGRPIIYSGTGTAGGHCWVVDGYTDTMGVSFFHCNWGWSGSGPNGYYSIDSMSPPILGTGGGGGGFNANQDAIMGIKPDFKPITGTLTVCAGANVTLADVTTGGTWSSATPSIATVSSYGVVTGIAAGTSVISYTISGNSVTATVTVNPGAIAGTILGGNVAICLGQVLTLTDSSIGGTWSSTSGSVASVASGVVTGVTGGTTTISYSISNSCGSAATSTSITVSAAPAITATPAVVSPGTTPCEGTSASYSASCSGATSFTWTVSGTGWGGSSTSSSLVATAGSGTGTIVVRGTNACGSGPAYTLNITPNALPTVPTVALSGTLPCTGATSATYNATSTSATSYVWSVLGTGWSGSSTTSSITLTLGTGTANLICKAVNTCGNSLPDTTVVSSSPLPAAPAVILSGSVPCAGATSATYNAISGGATSYNWTVSGTGWSGSSATGTLNVTIGTGTGTIVCKGINACGSGTTTTVHLTPGSPVSAATTISPITAVCSGNNVTFITSAITGATSYLWTVTGTGWSGSSTTNMLTVTAGAGAAMISVAGVGPCGTGASYTLPSVVPSISPNASFSVGSHVEPVAVSDLITYTGSTLSSGAFYTWNFSGGAATPGSGIGPNLVSWSTPGLKTITLSVTDGGCTSVVYSDTVRVGSTTDLPNQTANTGINIIPNPTTGFFEILFDNEVRKDVVVRLMDMQGRLVYNKSFASTSNNKVSVDVSYLPNSVYIATIVTEGVVVNREVVIGK